MLDKAELKRRLKEISAKQHQSRVMLEKLQKEMARVIVERKLALGRFERRNKQQFSILLTLLQRALNQMDLSDSTSTTQLDVRQYILTEHPEFMCEHIEEFLKLVRHCE